ARIDAALFELQLAPLALHRAVVATDDFITAVRQAVADLFLRQGMALVANPGHAHGQDHARTGRPARARISRDMTSRSIIGRTGPVSAVAMRPHRITQGPERDRA